MRWLKGHAWLIGLAVVLVGGLVLALVLMKKDRPKLDDLVDQLKLEKKVIDAQAEVRKTVAVKGHEEALAEIKKKHEEKIKALDEDKKKKVDELANDPEALVDHLLRITG